MASPAACKTLSSAPPRALLEANHHPEPACLEAQKWIEAVTGKSFGDKDFRSALENGILLCELLSAIKPGLVRKINRLPTPIAGLDNLTVFLRGCEELGLKGSQLFDPGDLQDTSIRANLKDSDCNRKLKNVLNTVFWLGKAASGCAFYSGPTLNLKEFEGLLAQMRVESDDGATSPQNRSVRDSGYDCWDSERSESLSPPRHTRDNSLDSLDSFGSRSQHSPSPDVGNRGASDGRGSDSEADGPGRKPDVRKDDMLARRTASSESRSSIPFNQFLPNRNNATAYIPTPRRKMNAEEGEQRSHSQAIPEQTKRTGLQNKAPKTVTWAPENNGEKPKQEEQMVTQETLEQRKLQKLEKAGIKVLPAAIHHISPATIKEKETSSEPPSIILRCENDFMNSCKTAWDSSSDGEEEGEKRKVPDVRKDDLASRRGRRGLMTAKVHQFVPSPECTNKDMERWEGIRRASQQTLQDKDISGREAVPDIITRRDNPFLKEKEEVSDEGKVVEAVPNKQRDDLARRRAQSRPLPQRDAQMSLVTSSMSQADVQRWERLKMTEPSFGSSVSVAAEHQIPFKDPTGPTHAGARGRQEGEDQEKGDTMRATDTIVSKVTESPPSPALALPAHSCSGVVEAEQQTETERTDAEEGKKGVNEKTQKKPFWLEDELPPIMVSRRVAFLLNESVSMTDMVNEEEAGHLPLLSQSRHERMHEQYNNFQEEEDHWQDDLARWKSRRRSASQELIRKEEERKRMEKMKEERRDGNKRKSIKTYKEIVEEKERREAELCEAYRNAATPEEAALVLQRYALRFTISDATLDSLKLPRSTSKPKHDLNGTTQEDKPASPVNGSEMLEHLPKPKPASLNQKHTNPENMETDVIQELEKSGATSSSSTTSNSPVSADTNSQIVPPQSPQFCKPTTQFTESAATNQKDLNSGDTLLRSKHMSFQDAQEQSQTMQPQFPQSQPTQSKPVQLQLAQPQSEQLQPTQPQSEQPTQSQSEQPQPAQSQSEQLQPAQSEQLQPAQSQLEQMQPAQSQSEQLQPVQSHIEQLQPAQPHSEHLQPVIYTQPIHTLPSPAPARSVPMLVAKPYCQPRTTLKPVKMDGLVRVNGEMMEDSVVSPSPSALLESLQEKQENKDVSSKQAEEDNPPEEAVENPKTAEPLTPPPQNEKTAAAAASAISSLIGGRSCTITTTIVTELTQTVVEPLYPEIQSNKKTPIEEKTQAPASPSNKQKYSPTVTDGLEESCVTIETPMLNLAKRVNHWVWDPNEERKRLERWQQEQERLLQEQYLREQEKLKKEWEKAQIEVEEEERKHNEEERRILEETVTPLSPTGLLQQGSGHTAVSAPAPENNNKGEGNVSLEQNGKKVPTGREDQHASKLHFFQDSACDGQPSKRPEPWKTASLDRNPQLSQTQNVKRSGSHDAVTGEQQSSPTTPQPPSPSRCVSGKRLCSGCSKPLGKGAAMIIDTLGLYFHMGCFKCGVCKGQLGDASAGTDVRIRNGQLSCHECYIASRGRGQPTTL
uniref:LIM and calponin homology domains 1a n=1 Tax=Oryzias latipes TaxID=8090 RepID=A0A3P9L2C6_ORYLA